MNDNEIDDMEIGRCSCGLVFYSFEYAISHVCLGGNEGTPEENALLNLLDGSAS